MGFPSIFKAATVTDQADRGTRQQAGDARLVCFAPASRPSIGAAAGPKTAGCGMSTLAPWRQVLGRIASFNVAAPGHFYGSLNQHRCRLTSNSGRSCAVSATLQEFHTPEMSGTLYIRLSRTPPIPPIPRVRGIAPVRSSHYDRGVLFPLGSKNGKGSHLWLPLRAQD